MASIFPLLLAWYGHEVKCSNTHVFAKSIQSELMILVALSEMTVIVIYSFQKRFFKRILWILIFCQYVVCITFISLSSILIWAKDILLIWKWIFTSSVENIRKLGNITTNSNAKLWKLLNNIPQNNSRSLRPTLVYMYFYRCNLLSLSQFKRKWKGEWILTDSFHFY